MKNKMKFETNLIFIAFGIFTFILHLITGDEKILMLSALCFGVVGLNNML